MLLTRSAFSAGARIHVTDNVVVQQILVMFTIARFRDVQWRQIWCIVGLRVDENKTTAVRVIVKRIFQ